VQYFTIKLSDNMKASSFKTSQKFFVDSQKLLPLSRFLPQTGRAWRAHLALFRGHAFIHSNTHRSVGRQARRCGPRRRSRRPQRWSRRRQLPWRPARRRLWRRRLWRPWRLQRPGCVVYFMYNLFTKKIWFRFSQAAVAVAASVARPGVRRVAAAVATRESARARDGGEVVQPLFTGE
jgi:hypothetical protein